MEPEGLPLTLMVNDKNQSIRELTRSRSGQSDASDRRAACQWQTHMLDESAQKLVRT